MKQPAFNPYLPGYEYIPDAEPRAFGDRVYIYGSHDFFGGDRFCPGDYVCWSAPADDLGNWRNEGVIYRRTQDPNNRDDRMDLYAPDCVQGPDGRYYLYYTPNRMPSVSIAVSEHPAGPFEYYGTVSHPDGTPYGFLETDTFGFDPGVLVDDDGSVWMYVGFAPFGALKEMFRKNGRVCDGMACVKLERDMKTVIRHKANLIPGHDLAIGTEFEDHGFYEASSPRKINGRYYLIYSSERSHDLCYAVSSRPDGEFRYGGIIVSIGDIGYQGNTEAVNYTGNTHGGLVELGNQWYVFYHRQTNRQKCARQGCAEKIEILGDGSIPQVEITSCGLNAGPLPAKGIYEARIACNLSSREGTFAYLETFEDDPKGIHPYFTQLTAEREEDSLQYIANFTSGALAGFKYFRFSGDETEIRVSLRGSAKGRMTVSAALSGKPAACIEVAGTPDFSDFCAPLSVPAGDFPLFFTFDGSGAMDLMRFEIR